MPMEEYRAQLKILLSMLEEDADEVGQAFEGEILSGYRLTMQKEIDHLQQMIKKTYF